MEGLLFWKHTVLHHSLDAGVCQPLQPPLKLAHLGCRKCSPFAEYWKSQDSETSLAYSETGGVTSELSGSWEKLLADCSNLRLGGVKPPSQLGAGGLRLRTPRPPLGFGKPSDPGVLDNNRISGRLRRVPFRLQDSSERLVLIPPPAKAFPGGEGHWPRHASARPGRSAHPGARWPREADGGAIPRHKVFICSANLQMGNRPLYLRIL